MKMPYHLLLVCIPLAAFTVTDWITFPIDDQVSVQLPSQPTHLDVNQLKNSSPEKVRLFSAKDAAGTYFIVRLDASDSPSTLDTKSSRQDFYEGMISGMLKNQQGILLSRTTFTTAAGEGVEIKYKAIDKGTGKMTVKYSRSLLVAKTSYSFNFLSQDRQDTTGVAGNEQRRRFFDSIVAKPSSAPKN
ncbi:hypothetical protein [Hymenobacter guriensis]|uniref:DUF1795 domain-containing protein n=1 Tax=Hymenobacter guriensis TaxID=2793065 RepID=A0ABS0L486_9BACT|nr:hypothetical protein [Hymenobacter guriensis]MBG8554945.1 hypothetical protein [Hymenobacter guriensis]